MYNVVLYIRTLLYCMDITLLYGHYQSLSLMGILRVPEIRSQIPHFNLTVLEDSPIFAGKNKGVLHVDWKFQR